MKFEKRALGDTSSPIERTVGVSRLAYGELSADAVMATT